MKEQTVLGGPGPQMNAGSSTVVRKNWFEKMLSNCPLSKRVQNLDETERTEEQNWAGWVV